MMRITKDNAAGEHVVVEMILSSLFDKSFSTEKYGLVISNGHLEYTYIKGPLDYEFYVKVISLEKPTPKYTLRFLSKPFTLNRRHFNEFFY